MNWISVKDRLPEKEDEYLVITKDLLNSCVCLHIWDKILIRKKEIFEWSRCLQESYDHPYPCGEVTHWMPLPKLPNKSQYQSKCRYCGALDNDTI
jgi:hypothetical protein